MCSDTLRSINVFNKDIDTRRYSSGFSFAEHRIAYTKIYAPKIDKYLHIFGELYPEYLDNIENSIQTNCNRILNEFGIERLGLITKYRLKKFIQNWRYKLVLSALKKKHLTQKDILYVYNEVFKGVCKILNRYVKIQVVETKGVTIQKIFNNSIIDGLIQEEPDKKATKKGQVGNKRVSLYTKDKLRSPLWWLGYIKETLNRLTEAYGKTATLGLFGLVAEGFRQDMRGEILNKPRNWGCSYRLTDKDGKWTETQFNQILEAELSTGVSCYFLFRMFTELYSAQFENEKINTVKKSTFRDNTLTGELYTIFKHCKGNRMRFFGCMEVLTNISLLALDVPQSNKDKEKMYDYSQELIDEFMSYLTKFSNIEKIKTTIMRLSFTREFLRDMIELGHYKELENDLQEYPVECSVFLNKMDKLNLELMSLLQIFTNNDIDISAFLWDIWDTKILDNDVTAQDIRTIIDDKILNSDVEFSSKLYAITSLLENKRMLWLNTLTEVDNKIIKSDETDSISVRETLSKLTLFLSLSNDSVK